MCCHRKSWVKGSHRVFLSCYNSMDWSTVYTLLLLVLWCKVLTCLSLWLHSSASLSCHIQYTHTVVFCERERKLWNLTGFVSPRRCACACTVVFVLVLCCVGDEGASADGWHGGPLGTDSEAVWRFQGCGKRKLFCMFSPPVCLCLRVCHVMTCIHLPCPSSQTKS